MTSRWLPLFLLLLPGCAAAAPIVGKIAAHAASAVGSGLGRGGGAESACVRPCDSGTSCNEKSGMCEPNFPTSPSTRELAPPAPANDDDSCAGLCLEGERCRIVANADVECIPAPK